MNKFLLPLVAWLSLSPVSLLAGEQDIVTVTSDTIKGELILKLQLDENHTIQEIFYRLPDATEDSRFSIADLDQGIVVMRRSGRDVVKLVSSTFEPASGGAITVVYLHNGLSNTYRRYEIELDRSGEAWTASVNETAGRRDFTRMHMKAKKILGQIVGIDKITVQ